MARRSMKAKIQPAVQTFRFNAPTVTGGSAGVYYIDLSQCASLMNRRFYRQGLNWAVAGIKIFSSVNGGVSIQKLPNTWVMSNAWEKSFRAWREMIKNAVDETGAQSVQGKFLDFKIFADAEHHRQGFANNLLPLSFDVTSNTVFTPTAGQWQASDVTLVDQGTGTSTDFELIAVGPNNPGVGASGKNAKSIIQGYADSRALPNKDDPNVPGDANNNWLINIFDEGNNQDSAVINMLETTGDNPPYPFEGDNAGTADTMYPGGETQLPTLQLHDTKFVTSTTIGGETYCKGGNFPCGLIAIGWQPESTAGLSIQIDMVPGNHRGYLAESMVEM